MKINVVSIFPEMFECLNYSIVGKAIKKDILQINYYNPRDYTLNKHKKVDDYAYGGSEGMVMTCQPLFDCINSIKDLEQTKLIYLSPRGKKLNQSLLTVLAKEDNLTLISGHYEGIDQRVIDHYCLEEVSIGDYILSGGEYASIILIDGVTRLLQGSLNNANSALNDSFSHGLLEGPVYTRPEVFQGLKVPDVLLSGNHQNIKFYNKRESLKETYLKRPDLLKKHHLNSDEEKLLKEIIKEVNNKIKTT